MKNELIQETYEKNCKDFDISAFEEDIKELDQKLIDLDVRIAEKKNNVQDASLTKISGEDIQKIRLFYENFPNFSNLLSNELSEIPVISGGEVLFSRFLTSVEKFRSTTGKAEDWTEFRKELELKKHDLKVQIEVLKSSLVTEKSKRPQPTTAEKEDAVKYICDCIDSLDAEVSRSRESGSSTINSRSISQSRKNRRRTAVDLQKLQNTIREGVQADSVREDSVGNSNTTIEEDSEGSSDDLENPFASFVNPDISIPLLSEDED